MGLLRLGILAGLFALLGAAAAPGAEGEDWGSIKGQVVWAAAEEPVRPVIAGAAGVPGCLRNGPVLEQSYMVDKKTKGVRYVMVWLVSAKEPKNYAAPIPIHPAWKVPLVKTVTLDQPCCLFEPPVIALREGQVLECKNSSPIPHNVKIDGAPRNPSLNLIIPPAKSLDVNGWKTTGLGAVPVGCTIHGWMRCQIRVFNHPYYAVTDEKGQFEIKDAPAGEFRLVIWHPSGFWVKGDRTGFPLTIKPNATTDLGSIGLTPPRQE